jgi:hypothetical protein
MATRRLWEDPTLKPAQERDAAQKAHKRYIDSRNSRALSGGQDLLSSLREYKWRRQWERAQRQDSGPRQKVGWFERLRGRNGS